MNKHISIVYMVTFLAIIYGFAIVTFISPDKEISAIENRTLRKFPEISLAAVTTGRYFEKINQYWNDQIVFRNEMIRIYQNQKNSEIFNSMLFENLFEANKPRKPEDGTKIKNSRIVSKLVVTNNKWILPIPNKVVHKSEIDAATAKLNDAVTFAKDQKTEAYFVFNPSRTKALMHLYPKYFQTDAYAKSKEYFLSKLDKDVNVINVGEKFDTFTKAQLEELYFETDHHWNIKGAFIAYQEMITQLSKKSSKFEGKPMSLHEINVSTLITGNFKGSYNTQINYAVNPKNADRTPIYEPKMPFTFKNFEAISTDGKEVITNFHDFYRFKYGESDYSYKILYGGDKRKIAYENPKANNQLKVLLIKDSYMNPITPYLAQHFNKLTVLDNRYYSDFSLKKVLTSEKYDILIIACHDDNLFSDNYQFEKRAGE